MILFIIIGGFILKCVINQNPLDSTCSIVDFRTFGALATSGILELIFEFKGVAAIFQKKDR
jgi:hypothetical protein